MKWREDIQQLSEMAKEEPQAALVAFNTGISQRWKFIQRTLSGIKDLFQPLEDAICDQLIPALCGRQVSELERRILAMPYRYGGLAIRNPCSMADEEYAASIAVTAELSSLLRRQEMDTSKLDKSKVKEAKKKLKAEKEARLKAEYIEIHNLLDQKKQRLLEGAREKGASLWLSTLPLKRLGYTLNKQQFVDAVCWRYGWKLKDTPKSCVCGKNNSMDHILTCANGGYAILRHNAIRNAEAEFLSRVCKDVRIEPELLPVGNNEVRGNVAANARLDVVATGLWGPYERTYFDVRIFLCSAYQKRNIKLLSWPCKGKCLSLDSFRNHRIPVPKIPQKNSRCLLSII